MSRVTYSCTAPLQCTSARQYNRIFRTFSDAGVCVVWHGGDPFAPGAIATFSTDEKSQLLLIRVLCPPATISPVTETVHA